MNIPNLLSTPNPSPPADGQNTTPGSEEDAGVFGQVLALKTAGEQALMSTDPLLDTTNPPAWPAAWFKIFGQEPGAADTALDLLQETPDPGGKSPELSVTLTELIAALQPVVNQGSIALPPAAPADDEPGDLPGDEQARDEFDLKALSTLPGAALVQPPAVFSPPPALEVTLTPTVSPAAEVGPDGKKITTPGSTMPFARVVPGEQSELSGPPAGAAPVNAASQPAASFVQELAQQMTPGSETVATERSPAPAPGGAAKPIPQPEVESLPETPQPVLQSASTPPATVTGEVKRAAIPAALQLPDVPALHQIVEKMSLISRQGETEVRLHLHPESLGQVIIQLHVTRDETSVRMLAETAQARNLIQEHLPQLKAAFSDQGLQLDNLAVSIGSDASAFDMQRRQPGDWPQPASHPPSVVPIRETDPAASPGPVSRAGSSLYRVDYQV